MKLGEYAIYNKNGTLNSIIEIVDRELSIEWIRLLALIPPIFLLCVSLVDEFKISKFVIAIVLLGVMIGINIMMAKLDGKPIHWICIYRFTYINTNSALPFRKNTMDTIKLWFYTPHLNKEFTTDDWPIDNKKFNVERIESDDDKNKVDEQMMLNSI